MIRLRNFALLQELEREYAVIVKQNAGRPETPDWMKASVVHPGSGPVRLLNSQGQYLAQGNKEFMFTTDADRAMVFEYDEGKAQKLVAFFADKKGIPLTIEYVEDPDVYEWCDNCKEMQLPHDTFFNGRTFLCLDCKIQSAGNG